VVKRERKRWKREKELNMVFFYYFVLKKKYRENLKV
jgi:hypothetical protein